MGDFSLIHCIYMGILVVFGSVLLKWCVSISRGRGIIFSHLSFTTKHVAVF